MFFDSTGKIPGGLRHVKKPYIRIIIIKEMYTKKDTNGRGNFPGKTSSVFPGKTPDILSDKIAVFPGGRTVTVFPYLCGNKKPKQDKK